MVTSEPPAKSLAEDRRRLLALQVDSSPPRRLGQNVHWLVANGSGNYSSNTFRGCEVLQPKIREGAALAPPVVAALGAGLVASSPQRPVEAVLAGTPRPRECQRQEATRFRQRPLRRQRCHQCRPFGDLGGRAGADSPPRSRWRGRVFRFAGAAMPGRCGRAGTRCRCQLCQ